MQKHRHNKYILLAALERCCDSFLDVEKAFSVIDPIDFSNNNKDN